MAGVILNLGIIRNQGGQRRRDFDSQQPLHAPALLVQVFPGPKTICLRRARGGSRFQGVGGDPARWFREGGRPKPGELGDLIWHRNLGDMNPSIAPENGRRAQQCS